MAFRFPLSSGDGRVHREEELTLMRKASQRNAPARPDGTTTPAAMSLSDTKQPAPASDAAASSSPNPPRRRVVLADPVAFRYLEDGPGVEVIERRTLLRGYELYLVEQWACSRQSPTLVIVTYTGDERHAVVVGVLDVPEDETSRSPRLRYYFNAIQQCHARPKNTPLGELMLTNLSSFPSALTVIPVPDGDIKAHRHEFLVNENLKRLGCSGRSGMTLSEPSAAAKAKFLQLYKTSEKIPFAEAVIELVKLCQVALFLFGKLENEYIDGLLCDVTEKAVGDWWNEFGAEYYNTEPADGILGPTAVAALLGLLMGARNRLSYYGAPISKDVFDIDATKRGISYFQKYQKLDRTRRLDRQTLHKLHSATAKAAAGEGWGVQKAVKSTVTEIGGKRGELVLGMVGGKDKGGIGDIETLDLDHFISLAHGERAKWLWRGKPKRSTLEQQERSLPDLPNVFFGREESHDAAKKPQPAAPEEDVAVRRKESSLASHPSPASGPPPSATESPAEKEALRKGVFKSVAGKMSDARSGFGRIKDAVSGGGYRAHAVRPSRDESGPAYSAPHQLTMPDAPSAFLSTPTPGNVNRAFTWKNKPEEYRDGYRKDAEPASAPFVAGGMALSETPESDLQQAGQAAAVLSEEAKRQQQATELRGEVAQVDAAIADLAVSEMELQGPALEAERRLDKAIVHLHRRHSLAGSQAQATPLNENRWPRRLSFSQAEDAVLRWTELAVLGDDDDLDGDSLLDEQAQLAEVARGLYMQVQDIVQGIEPWVENKVHSIEATDRQYAHQYEELQELYFQLTDAYQHSKHLSEEMLGEERANITEAVKDVEVWIAKLEYEINALVSRVSDVEDGVAQFEVQVDAVEKLAEELKAQLETESWLHWAVRTITGIGTGPNITQGRR